MELHQSKLLWAAVLFGVAVCVAGFAAHLTTLAAWAATGCLAFLPTVLVVRFWSPPDASMSESIRSAIR
jgi:hypothetical protein